jgi:Protein of unknown function (DUF2905)
MAGLLLATVGALLWSGFGKGWLGRLPGDIHYSKGGFGFHFPIVTLPAAKRDSDTTAVVVQELISRQEREGSEGKDITRFRFLRVLRATPFFLH